MSALSFILYPQVARATNALESRDGSSVVHLTVAANQTDADQLAAVARELLARLQLQVEFRRVERLPLNELRQPSTAYFARVWIMLRPEGGARLYLEHSARDRLLRRDVTGDSDNGELLREELGHILQAALEGLKAGEEIGAPRQEALADEEPAPQAPSAAAMKPSPEPSPPASRRRFRFGPRYEAVLLGDRGVVEDGPGAAVGALLPSSARWGVELFGAYRRPFRVERAPIRARFQSFTLGAQLTLEAFQADRSTLRIGAGLAADLLKITPSASASDVELTPSAWRRVALGRATITYSFELASFVALEAALGAELDPSRSRYVLRTTDGERELFAPWALRPLLSLGGAVW